MAMATHKVDVAVVGTGPGGYVAAIRCAQLGLTVAAVEDDRPGGVCLNWGCIPTKALLRNAEVVHLVERAADFGISVGEVQADYAAADQAQPARGRPDGQGRRVPLPEEQDHARSGPRRRSRSRRPSRCRARARPETIEARAVILATGSEPKSLPGIAIDEQTVISSNGAVRNERRPASLIVIGAGAVGVEFADVYRAYGVEVTVLEALPRVLPIEDEEVSAQLARNFSRRGITLKTGVKVSSVKPGGAGVIVETDGGRFEAEQVLMAVGRGARVKDVGLEGLGVAMERGFVRVSPRMETSGEGRLRHR